MASIKDVARIAKVSTATVSRVISGTDYVSEEVKERVLAAIKSLNYRPNRVARSLRVRHRRESREKDQTSGETRSGKKGKSETGILQDSLKIPKRNLDKPSQPYCHHRTRICEERIR